MTTESTETDQSFLLPSGDDLRVFLIQECVTPAMLRRVLRERGVFIESTDKKDLLPFLLLTYLSPDEFEFLLDAARTREDSPKLRSNHHSLACQGKSLLEMLPSEIDLHELARDKYGNSQIIGSPIFVSDPQGDAESYVMRFGVWRTNVSADWTKARRVHEGEVRYTLNAEQNRIDVVSTHTASETERVNRIITRTVEKELREREYIEIEKDTRVVFDSFNNRQRILFFMKFSALNEPLGLNFKRLSDLSFARDESADISGEARLNWMKDKVKKVRLSGDGLHDIFFFTDKSCQPLVILWQVEMTYSFSTRDETGQFTAVLEFAEYATTKSMKSEFQISIDTLTIAGKLQTHPDCRALKKEFLMRLNREKQKAYIETMQSVEPQGAEPAL